MTGPIEDILRELQARGDGSGFTAGQLAEAFASLRCVEGALRVAEHLREAAEGEADILRSELQASRAERGRLLDLGCRAVADRAAAEWERDEAIARAEVATRRWAAASAVSLREACETGQGEANAGEACSSLDFDPIASLLGR